MGSLTVTEPLLYSPTAPVNLLGRDLLSKFNFTISCTPGGLICETPGIDPSALQEYIQIYVGAQRYTLIDKDLIYQIIDVGRI